MDLGSPLILKSLYHSWGKEMSDKDGWSALFWNNHDQPRALNRFVDIQNFRKEGATMLAASIHLSVGHLISIWARKSG